MTSHGKRPRDPSQLAKLMVDIAAGEALEQDSEKNPHAVKAGRLGGMKGGVARAEAMTKSERSAAARRAAKARWKDH